MQRAPERVGFAGVVRRLRAVLRARRGGALAVVVAVAAGPAAAAGSSASAVQAPDDPLFRHQWNLSAIQIPAAWGISRGAGATVAVLDTGVAYETRGPYRRAPDLAGTRFVAGYDFVDDDAHPNDVAPPEGRRSHGTQMAAIIAQTAGNALGGAGVAPDAAIMPIRVLEPDLSGSVANVARGVRWAADHGADVVNLSLSSLVREPVVSNAIAYAATQGVTVVAAAGNDGHTPVSWPAADPGVIAVGAVGRNLSRAPYSNYGRGLDLVAPGGAGEDVPEGFGPSDGIVAQTLKGGPRQFCFCFTASTSAAAAQVSAVAALLIGSRRATAPAAVRAALVRSARDLGSDEQYGAGLVQAAGALRAAADGPNAATGSSRRGAADNGGAISPLLAATAGVALVALLAALGVVARRRRLRH